MIVATLLCAAGPVEFQSSNVSRTGDQQFIRLLAMQTVSGFGGRGKQRKQHKVAAPQHQDLTGLQLGPDDIAKVV